MQQQQTGQTEGFTTAGLAAMGLTETEVAAEGLASIRVAGIERKRVEAVVETLADLRGSGESLAEVAHDARNMVTALGLYCDLLEEPGVLTSPFLHYASELRLVATASRRLVEKLMALDLRLGSAADRFGAARVAADPVEASRLERARRWESMPAEPIDNLAAEVLANRNLLAALAGPAIDVAVDIEGGALPMRMNGEDLTRILVNLVKNAAEAMPEGGRIQVGLHELPAEASSSAEWPMRAATKDLSLTVDDNGPGIPQRALETVFDSGYTTHSSGSVRHGGWAATHRGLGLSITRSIVEAAGGSIHAANRAPAGARFEIKLPVRLR
jgi:signal transduction histidine kinase